MILSSTAEFTPWVIQPKKENQFSELPVLSTSINSETHHEERSNQYDADIVYATNNEIGFDYLRDNLKGDYESLCFKKEAFAIVDEVDSILIDESRTPLIISGKLEDKTTLYTTSNEFIKYLQKNDYELDEKNKNVILTDLSLIHI